MNQRNLVKCPYCTYRAPRYLGKLRRDSRGMSYGERQLRGHVMECHEAEYLAAQGLVEHEDISLFWYLDDTDIIDLGQRAL